MLQQIENSEDVQNKTNIEQIMDEMFYIHWNFAS
jgi:hypothetical protein